MNFKLSEIVNHKSHTPTATLDVLTRAVSVPVTVKCRIGVDEHDSYEHFRGFVQSITARCVCGTYVSLNFRVF